MTKRQITFLIIILCAVIACFLFAEFMTFLHPQRPETVKVFADFSELSVALEQAKFEEHELIEDEHIDTLVPTQQYCATGLLDGVNLELYAYEFSCLNDAKQYYANATGNHPITKSFGYVLSSSGSLIVFNQQYAYRLNTRSLSHLYAVTDALFDSFSVAVS